MVEVSPKTYSELIEKSQTTGVGLLEATLIKRGLKAFDTGLRIAKALEDERASKSAASDAAVRKAKLTRKLGNKAKLRKLQMKRAESIVASADVAIQASHHHRADIMRTKADARRQGKMISDWRRDHARA